MELVDKQLLIELRATLSKMEMSLGSINDAIIWVDETGTIQWCNKKFSELLQISKIEILGKKIQQLLFSGITEDIFKWNKILDSSLTDEKVNLLVLNLHGKEYYFEISANNFNQQENKTDIVIVFHDVSEKHLYLNELKKTNHELKIANEELLKNEIMQSKLAAIVESTDDAIISRSLNGIIESWNKGAERLYGYSAEEVIGKSAEMIYPNNRKEEFYYSKEQVKKGRVFGTLHSERLHKNGQIIPVSVTLSPIKNKKGKIVGSCSIARDISEIIKMIDSKNNFISVVSHELRTPLTSIQGALSLLVAGATGELPEKALKLLNIGKQNSDRLIRLINDILDVQKIESGNMQFDCKPIDIVEIIQEAIQENQAYADQFNIRIVFTPRTSCLVNIDHDRIIQVLTNLISNAIKFSTEKEINISLHKRLNLVRVEVINKGVGIPKESQSKLFLKFSQLKTEAGAVKGTGLGLNISKEIIERHGGVIGFESDPNTETKFYFDLPIYATEVISYYERAPKVVICEDDEHLAAYVKETLQKNNIESVIAPTGEDAKKLIAEQRIDAVILDLLVPDQDGIDLIKDLKGLNFNIPIIVLSVIIEEGKKQLNGNAISIIDWIYQPIDFERLMNAVRHAKYPSNSNEPTILHIEDDTDLLQIIGNLLEGKSTLIGVRSISEANAALEKNNFDLCILDLRLPDGKGVELLPILSAKHIPVIVFSAFELPNNYSNYVIKSLVKAKTSPMEFVKIISEVLTSIKEEETVH